MAKKGLILFLITTTLLTFTSCGLYERYSLDEDLHNRIECVWGEDDPSHIIYRGETYKFVGETTLFRVDNDRNNYNRPYEDDILLSWNGSRYIGYIDVYYSYTEDSPLFIYENHMHFVYFREDYDYLTDIFVVDGTDIEVVYEDIFDSKQNNFDFSKYIEVVLTSKQCPRIETRIKLVLNDGRWYISLPDRKGIWTASEEFINTLSENGLI